MFDHIGRCIGNDEQGLLSLHINSFLDKNSLDEWALKQLFVKAAFIKTIKIENLEYTTPENRSVLLDLVA